MRNQQIKSEFNFSYTKWMNLRFIISTTAATATATTTTTTTIKIVYWVGLQHMQNIGLQFRL